MKKSYIFILWSLALILSFFLDKYSSILIQFRNPILDKIMIAISFLGSWVYILLFLVVILLWEKQKREWIPVVLISFAVTTLLTYSLKIGVGRSRPDINPLEIKTDKSFPSGHATAVFTAIPIIKKLAPSLKYFWLIFAILVIISRLYLGIHYISDLVAGSLIGYGISSLFIYIEDKTHFFKKSIFR